jgi:adenosine deaminase
MLACDLHLHLDGSLRGRTLVELARAQGVLAGGAEESAFLSRLRFEDGMSLRACLDRFGITVGLLQTRAALSRVADELVRDCFVDGVRHLEVRLCPLLHSRCGLSPDEAVESVVAGLERGAAAVTAAGGAEWLSTGVIVSVLEGSTEAEIDRLVGVAVAHAGSGVVGLDLAGDEALFDASRFERHFARARTAGLGITVHAGEGHAPSHVIDAIERLGADRIGHGTSAAGSREALELLAESRAVVECCISSNVHTGAIRSHAEHPLRVFMNEGVRAVIATDNRFFSDTSLSREYDVAAERLGLTREELARIAVESGRAAFLPDAERRKLVDVLEGSVKAEAGGAS